MTTNKKRPSDLALWDGDLSANLHVHRPGASMKVSLQEIVDAVPVPAPSEPAEQIIISETGKTLVAKETVAEMKVMLEIPDSQGPGVELQGTKYDVTEGKALRFGAFGLGGGRQNAGVSVASLGLQYADNMSMPNGFYHAKSTDWQAANAPVASLISSSGAALLHVSADNPYSAFQILAGKGGAVYARARDGNNLNGWLPWFNLDGTTAVFDEIGAVLLARVLDGTKGTLQSNGFYINMAGRAGLKPVAFDGSDMPTATPYLNGTWTQITYCDHSSADPVARMALWRKIK